ncbi:MAG: RsmE family RNA methyltransferase [Planctomycetaceae bacterium]
MSERFLLPSPPRDGRATLQGDEARHLARVLRAKPGDEVTVFDGMGHAWRARVAAVARDTVGLEIVAALPAAPAARVSLSIAVALPKGDRQKWLAEKLSELGVERLLPLVTERGVAEATDAARARLERAVIEACKQCGRDRLMAVDPPRTVAEAVARAAPGTRLLLADPRAAAPPATTAASVLVLVGPEGGFTPQEESAAVAAGAERILLAPHVLRVETAAVAAAARLV